MGWLHLSKSCSESAQSTYILDSWHLIYHNPFLSLSLLFFWLFFIPVHFYSFFLYQPLIDWCRLQMLKSCSEFVGSQHILHLWLSMYWTSFNKMISIKVTLLNKNYVRIVIDEGITLISLLSFTLLMHVLLQREHHLKHALTCFNIDLRMSCMFLMRTMMRIQCLVCDESLHLLSYNALTISSFNSFCHI